MHNRVTKFRSINLFGETPKQESKRFDRVRSEIFKKSIKRKNKLPDPALLREIRRVERERDSKSPFFFKGTTKFQRRNRKRILKKNL